MAIFEWRKFNFFDLKENADNGKLAETLKDATITTSTSGNNQIVLCDSSGNIHIFTKTWESISFKGHDGEIFLSQISRQNNLLVTVGNDENNSLPTFKVWNLTKQSKSGVPTCIRTVKTALQRPTALGVSESGQYMAIGFDRGSISFYRGDISRERTKTQKTLSGGTSAITGIAFKHSGKIIQMFVCSDSGVLVYNILSRDKETKLILDPKCAPTRCCALQTIQNSGESHFMVGRDDAVYCYTSDDRGPCYALEGEKKILQWFRSHLLTISKPSKSTISSQKDEYLTVIDIQNKFIVFSAPIDTVITILIEYGTCYIITINKNVYHLDEKDLQSKLSLLFKKNLYDIAIRIAKMNQYDNENLSDIFRKYGDHLYNKGDYAGSVEQYNKTIGYLEPSYVIRKYLDSRYINCLTDYLQELHKQSHATPDHTTLLLNCFTRLEHKDKLNNFLKTDNKNNLIYNIDIAINVCRNNNSIDLALILAKNNNKHDYVISILIENLCQFNDAINYIKTLKLYDIIINIKKYGYILIKNCPNETTDIIKKICTNYNEENSLPDNFIHLFINNHNNLIDFLEHLINNMINCNKLVLNTLIEYYLIYINENIEYKERLINLLKNFTDVYDKSHVLIILKKYNFWDGIIILYENDKLYYLIINYYLNIKNYDSLLKYCKYLGKLDNKIWLQTLNGLRNDKKVPSHLLSQILQVIAQEKLQSPLQILNCLSVNNGPNLLSVRDYFIQVFNKEIDIINNDEILVNKYKNDTNILREHINFLKNGPIEFRSTLCDTCHQPLSLPSLYFHCQHAYHQDCVRSYSENDKDCPVCHIKNIQLIDALRAQNESRGQHELFHNLLDRSLEPYSVVAEYFGRGLFNKILIIEENDNIKDDEQQQIQSSVNDLPKQLQKQQYSVTSDLEISQPQQKSISKPTTSVNYDYVPKHDNRYEEFKKPPMAEGRMRTLEQRLSKKVIKQTKTSKNPFDEDDDNTTSKIPAKTKTYDETKNPFADDNLDDDNDNDPKNPFNEYDNNLNPFS